MTPAELRTLRDSLGLTAEQVAQMAGVRDRTVRRWEAGDWPVPQDVADALRRLDAQIEHHVAGAVEGIAERPQRPDDVVLVRYRTAEAMAHYLPDMASLPPSVHGALIDRVRVALGRLGIASRIVWMDPPAYTAWLGRRRDSEAMRAAWAAEQLAQNDAA